MSSERRPRALTRLGNVLLVATAYFIAGRLALLMAIPPGYATAVWPAAGIALACILRFGNGVWPGITVGSFLVNVGTSFDSSTTATILRSVGIAMSLGTGAALQATAAGFLVRRFIGYPNALERERDIARFFLLGGPIGCAVGATWGVTTLAIANVVPSTGVAFSWFTWWVGDTIGVAIFAPLVLIFVGEPREGWRRRRLTVASPLALGFIAITALFVRTSTWEMERLDTDFARRGAVLAHALERRMDQYVEAVESIAGLHRTENAVDREGFRTFVAGTLARHAGIQGLGWNPYVRRQTLEPERSRVNGGLCPLPMPAHARDERQIVLRPARAPRDHKHFAAAEERERTTIPVGLRAKTRDAAPDCAQLDPVPHRPQIAHRVPHNDSFKHDFLDRHSIVIDGRYFDLLRGSGANYRRESSGARHRASKHSGDAT